jgi:mono/diheme cytochrome c family protein
MTTRHRAGLAAVLVTLAATCIAGASANGQDKVTAADRARLDRGKAVYDTWCAACHDPGPRHPGTQALDVLYKGAKPGALVERTDLVPKLTETFVRRGVSVMPPFRKTEISDADLAALAAYLAPKR